MKSLFYCIPLLLLSGCKNGKESVTVERKSITESVYASGVVKAQGQYQSFALVSGILKEIKVNEGDSVSIGDTLFVIDNRSSSLSADNAALAYELSQKNANANSDRLQELETAKNLALEKLKNDSLMMVRQQKLWQQNIGSKVEVEQRELAFATSKSNYKSAVNRLDQAKLQLESEKNMALNNLKISKKNVGDFVVTSELNGRVYDIMKDPGDLVSPQIPMAIVGSADSFVMELQVDEYDITLLRLGQKVLVSMDSYKGQVFEAVLSKINPIMNSASRTFLVEATFTKQPTVLYPNLTVEANIVLETHANALIIPRSYLIRDSLVLTSDKDTTKVTTSLRNYEYIEITNGIIEGQKIYKP
jgi:multidrug efflux pump subunit AcrA (membrane-fusion protein)